MRSRIYFDIVSLSAHATTKAQPSITDAFSIFFSMFSADVPSTGSLGGVSARTEESRPKSKNTVVGVDMDPKTKEVYWVELGKDPAVYSAIIEDEQFVVRQRRQFHGHRKIVEFGLLSPEDIALDNVAKNIYITDAGLPAVVVCSLLHDSCRIIVETDIHKPRAIIADSSVGWITYTDWGNHPGIFLVSMDGEKRETLIETEVVWPNGLAADYETNQLYWADARLNKIERVDLKTRRRTEIVHEVNSNPFSVSVFENRIYWSDWAGNDIKSCNKYSGNGTKNMMHADDVYGIHIYHPDLHKTDVVNPCWSKHCSHMCLLKPSSPVFANRDIGAIEATCACPDSMELHGSTCRDVDFSFLLINVRNYIGQVFPYKIGLHAVQEIIYSRDHAIQDIAADWTHFRIFFQDSSQQHIYIADLMNSHPKLDKLVPSGKSVRGMIYDRWSDNLYWLDKDAGTLALCAVGTRFHKIVRRNLDQPTSMVFDRTNRVFYIATLGSKPSIIRADILGDERSDVTLVDSDIDSPVALHLDQKSQRLYWADAMRETIESVGLDVKSRSTGLSSNSRLKHRMKLGTISGFAIYSNSFVWTIKGGDHLFKVDMEGGRDSRPITFRLPPGPSSEPSGGDKIISVDRPFAGALPSACNSRGCSHGCVLGADRQAHCICPENYLLQGTNNCVEVHELPHKIVLPATQHYQAPQIQPSSTRLGPMHDLDQDPNRKPVHEALHEAPHETVSELVHEAPHEAPHPGRSSAMLAQPSNQSSMTTSELSGSSTRVAWLIALLLLLAVVGLGLLYRQGRLPRRISQLSLRVRAGGQNKDRVMLLMDS